jgi:PilZ domain-containing protein
LRFLKQLKNQDFCRSTQLIVTTHRLLDERLGQLSHDLAIHACFNKARPLEELVCLATAIFPPRGHNLRASRRFPVKFLVHYAIGASQNPYYATNMSRGGMFILKSKPDVVGTQVKLAFTLPGSAVSLNATAKVVRAVHQALEVGTSHYHMFPPGNGLAFLEMTTEHRQILHNFCQREETRIFGMAAVLTIKSKDEITCQLTA